MALKVREMAFGAVQFRLFPSKSEICQPRRPFYQHMSAFGWSDLPPEGSKGALEGSKTFKLSMEYATWADSGT